jgi:hypothetical protein
MKRVMKDKKVMSTIAVLVLAVALFASGVIASPPTSAGDPPVESKINYQGQLTDDAGNPLNGTYDMEFLFYDSVSGGSQVGITITEDDVEVTNGLFSVKLDVDQSDFNGQGLWLEVMVEGETLSPRQEILPVPYALSLKSGAVIEGNSDYGLSSITTNSYGLYGESSSDSFGAGVIGVNTGGVGDGIQAVSDGRAGIAAWGEGANTYGGFFSSDNDQFDLALGGAVGRINTDPDDENSNLVLSSNNDVTVRLDNDGGENGVFRIKNSGGNDVCTVNEDGNLSIAADSYIFISGNDLIRNLNTDSTRWDCQTNGAVRIWRGGDAGSKWIYIPITVPGVLYGQEVTVEELTIYYTCQDGTKNYIYQTYLYKQTGADSAVTIVGDNTHRTSNTATSYALSLTENNILSSDQGILGLNLGLHFEDDTNYIQFGGARLRLGHD